MNRDAEYAAYREKLLGLGYPEREVDEVLAQMRLEDESELAELTRSAPPREEDRAPTRENGV